MRHAKDHRKLGRNPSHRKALLKNLLNSLIDHERITTTVAKAKELRRVADRAITLGKKDTTHARRMLFAILVNKRNTEKVFAVLAKRYAGRSGGYTRIIRTGFRSGDGAEMAIIEYLPAVEIKSSPKKQKKKK
ncbi:MAG: 50S ribosomal protein L17 [Deltaproteobacteria bacterium]|nr:50S ribosomal protein L17 [Deltaproteobacteria bacterium]